MTNHPGRTPGSAQERMTPEIMGDIIKRMDITQERAAELSGVALRTMKGYLAGDRKIPRSASGLLAVSCILLGAPAGLLLPYLPASIRERLT